MKLKDYYNQELDLTDPKELLDQDPEYAQWSEDYSNGFNEIEETVPQGKDSLEDRKH
jgi:hypothetical protein